MELQRVAGMDASATWLASRQSDALERVALTPSVRALRGAPYRRSRG
jgi:hypothetical protein